MKRGKGKEYLGLGFRVKFSLAEERKGWVLRNRCDSFFGLTKPPTNKTKP